MRFSVIFAATLATASGRILRSESLEVIEGSYVVVLKANATSAQRDAHMSLLGGDARVTHSYEHVFKGYAVSKATEYDMHKLSEHPDVDYIEADGVVRAFQGCQTGPANPPAGLWGLSRVSFRTIQNPIQPVRFLGSQGAPVFILDTGIYLQHNDFGGRATHIFDATGEGSGDGNGHGTHCAGTAAGQQYGVSKQAALFDVKVLNRGGSGQFAWVIAGIDTVTARSGPRVASLSLGGGLHVATNQAVERLVAAGGVVSIASGNSNANACNTSPASAAGGLTVNALGNTDARAGFSNWGTCTHIFAPGQNVLSAWIGSPTATNTISGTSMACPHVTGIVSDTWGGLPGAPGSEVRSRVLAAAVQNVVTNPGTGSPNLLAQGQCAQ